MKHLLILLTTILFTLAINGQSKEQLIMNEYSENYGKPNYGNKFVTDKLNPAILQVEKYTCETKDMGLLASFLKMISKTKDSTNKFQANILGGIFICKPEPVQKYLTQLYTEKYFKDMLKSGFKNRTEKEKTKNYSNLKLRIKYLTKEK